MEHGHRYTNRLALIAEMRNTIANSSLPTQTSTILKNYGKRVMEFFKQPRELTLASPRRNIAYGVADIRKLFLAHGITFMAVFIFLASLGFGSVGVGGGSSPSP